MREYLYIGIGFLLCCVSLCKAQQTYFDKDYYFPTSQAFGRNVFITQNGYNAVGVYAHDINIPGGKLKPKFYFTSLNNEGDTIFMKRYEHPVYGITAYKTIQTKDNGYLATGWLWLDTANYTQDSVILIMIRFNSIGDTLWTKKYLYAPQKKSYGADIYQEADSGFVVCGITNKYSANMRAMLLRLDKDGNVLWEKTYPNAGNINCYSLAKAADGGYLLGCTQWGGGIMGHE